MKKFIAVLILMVLGSVAMAQEGPVNPGPEPAPQFQGLPSDTGVMTDIHDIKPLQEVVFKSVYKKILVYGGLALVLVLLAFALFIVFKKKYKKKTGSVPVQPPDVIAMMHLTDIEPLMEKDFRQYYFELSALLRRYLEGRYHVDAPEMTTEEIIPVVSGLDMEIHLRDGLKKLLRFSDPIKYAGSCAGLERMRADQDFARELIGKTSSQDTGNSEDITE